jgi:PAS domain S-box-containing protein
VLEKETDRVRDRSAPLDEQVRRFEARLRAISEAAHVFAETTTDYQGLLSAIARILAEVVKEACAVFLLSDDGTALNAVALHADDANALEQLQKTYLGVPLLLTEHPALFQVVETSEPLLVPRLTEDSPSGTSDEQVASQRRMGLHSYLLVALRSRGRVLGVLSMGRFRSESPAFNEHDRELALTLAEHASLALENARLYVAAQEARRAAELAEDAIRATEETHRFFFESSPVPSYVIDAENMKLLAANSAALALYGYSRGEFLELEMRDLRAPEHRERLASLLQASGDAETAGLAHHVRKDGTIIHVEGRSHLTSFAGRRARFVVVRDHTERLQAEAAQRESEERLQRTVDSMMEGYTILGPDLRYLYVNAVGARQARLPKEELLGRTPMELYPEFEKSGMYALLQRCLAAGVPLQDEQELTLADGKKAYFEVNVQPTSEGLVILSIDTTERRQIALAREALEEQLRQSQRMEAVGRLAGGVAHDFNNLLCIILSYSDSALAQLRVGDPLRADVEETYKAARRAADLTKQLLLFSRQQVLEPKLLDLNEILATMERILSRVLGEHLDFVTLRDPALGKVRADRGSMEQVIMNLAVNARDAMPGGGKLTIETANVVLDDAFVRTHLGAVPGQYVLLAVTDTGVGMDKATRLRAFEPFFTTKEQGKGTGLGLSTVFGIVKQSGGCVWVYSEPDHGSTFKVYLPRVEGTVVAPTLPPAATDRRGSETILLVEDEDAVRVVAQRILERRGYRVIVARDPNEAIAVRERYTEPVHLLLTDVVMPRMSGAELAARFAERWPQTKVLYMSGYADSSIVTNGMLEHGESFLQKPFTPETLARKVRAVLDG